MVITGAAAACGIYILYTTFSGQPAKSGLHRSNAVHRRRSVGFSVEYSRPNEDNPLGLVIVRSGDVKYVTDVLSEGAPKVSTVLEQFPHVPVDLVTQDRLDAVAVESIMNSCWLARGHDRTRARLAQNGLDGISEAMGAGDIERMFRLAAPLLHQIVQTNQEVIRDAMTNYLANVAVLQHRNLEEIRGTAGEQSIDHARDSEIAETENMSGFEDTEREPEQGLKGLLYHIAETDAKRKAYEHRGIHCEGCGEKPIRGVRWHCLNCTDFDLCSTCEASTTHQKMHVFAKIKLPLPILSQPTHVLPLWYSGESRRICHPLNAELKAHFKKLHDFDEPHLDAYYDQFTSLANVIWKDDPALVKAAIDRRAFNKALTCERWPNRFRPNALYDRMFAFYDTDNNSLIGFGEFLDGLAYLRGSNRFMPLRRALRGYDIDSNGFVDRRDFLRLLRAKFEIQKVLVNDMVESGEAEQTQAALQTLHSSQPISSVFSWEEIPQGEERTSLGKMWNLNGDMQPEPGTKTVLGDNEGWEADKAHRPRRLPDQSHEQLQHHLSRFEEMLNDGTDDTVANSQVPLADRDSSIEPDEGADDAPLDQDVIWQITEDGFNEILDPMFKAKEEEHREVMNARPEIDRWREAIDKAVKKKEELKKALQEELKNAGQVDPLLETAMNSLNGSVNVKQKGDANAASASAFKSEIVPTDHESLSRREEEIAQKPLDELLDEAGYSTIENNNGVKVGTGAANGHAREPDHRSDSSVGTPDSELDRFLGLDGTSQPATSASASLDPTMPQNRPNSSSTPKFPPHSSGVETTSSSHEAGPSPPKTPAKPPSQDRLEYLGRLDATDREIIHGRGGPGRLSFDEVEAIVQSDGSKELRGLVTGWLEWASF